MFKLSFHKQDFRHDISGILLSESGIKHHSHNPPLTRLISFPILDVITYSRLQTVSDDV